MGPTPIRVNRLLHWLDGYDEKESKYLIDGFSNGFNIGFEGDFHGFEGTNLQSAIENPHIIDKKIQKEIESGRVLGPFNEKPILNLQCSPLGLVPKKEQGEFRMIHHLSHPEKLSINDHIPTDESFVQYASVMDAIQYIKQCGQGSFCCKTDIKSAFRIINLSRSQFKFLGFKWNSNYYIDSCLPFGLSSSCKIFERFSSALHWIAQNKLGISCMVHVLDDFIIVHKSPAKCLQQLKQFLFMCADIGIPMAMEKTLGPYQLITFLGYELDTINMESRLPKEKIIKCREIVEYILQKDKITLKELQSVIGLLNFACNVVLPGRAFLRRLIDLTIGLTKPFYRVRVTRSVKDDLHVWLEFLCNFNGRCMFLPDKWLSSIDLKLYTDASGSIGYAAIFGSQWFYGVWDESWRNRNIAVLEFYPIVLSVQTWATYFTNKCIVFHTDNQALVHVINKQTAKDKHIMFLVRQLVKLCLHYNILFRAEHLSTKENVLSDLLSRCKVQQFLQMAPWADRKSVPIPPLPPFPD